jgi:excisionase family DNA binding protein
MTDFKDFFSAPEVARILQISRVAVFKRIKSGDVRATKVGRNYVIPREEVLKALGLALGEKSKAGIDKAVRRAIGQYRETFQKLGKE